MREAIAGRQGYPDRCSSSKEGPNLADHPVSESWLPLFAQSTSDTSDARVKRTRNCAGTAARTAAAPTWKAARRLMKRGDLLRKYSRELPPGTANWWGPGRAASA